MVTSDFRAGFHVFFPIAGDVLECRVGQYNFARVVPVEPVVRLH